MSTTLLSANLRAEGHTELSPAKTKIKLNDIVKTFGDFVALDHVNFELRRGEVHALLGENGAGKSTLMNIVAGLYAPDTGSFELDGAPAGISSPSDAYDAGIGMVHQHYMLVKSFTAIENIQLVNGDGNYAQSVAHLREKSCEIAAGLGFDIDLDERIENMSISEQQRVEILKVLTADADTIILDEPTAVLTDAEADKIFAAMRHLAAAGKSIVFVTHKMREALNFSDKITVMRAGKNIATVVPDDVDEMALTSMIVGATIVERPQPSSTIGQIKLKVEGVSLFREEGVNALSELGFEVRSGEIYGIAGVGGNGQNELVAVLSGLTKPDWGTITLGSSEKVRTTPRDLRNAGVACIHSDRATFGLANDLSVEANFSISGVLAGHFGNSLGICRKHMKRATDKVVADFDIRGVRSPRQKVGLLSGGNAQKLVIAREFTRSPEIIIAHSPCRGLDVRASSAVHSHLRMARDRGGAVVLISEDLDEILLMSDRIGVMERGRIVAEFEAPADRHEIGKAMTGLA